MPPLEHIDLYQKAVLFQRVGTDGAGEQIVSVPDDDIDVRWEFQFREVMDPQGNRIALAGTVIARQSIPIGSILYPESIENWLGAGSGLTDADLYEVVIDETTPDLKGRIFRYEYGVMRYMGSLPQTE